MTLANSEDCLLRQKLSSGKKIQFYFEITTCDLSIYTMDYPKFMISNQKEESISALRENGKCKNSLATLALVIFCLMLESSSVKGCNYVNTVNVLKFRTPAAC